MTKDVYCFFFQAEDGIRDGHVTGVQTCALPILEESYGIQQETFIYAENSLRNKSILDIHNNIIRSGLEASSAIQGKADAEIGRASCRERGEYWVVGGAVQREKRR